jgi:serine/threonine protein kinase
MNSTRCVRCGKDLTDSNAPGDLPGPCPHCGYQPTIAFDVADSSDRMAANAGAKDTDPNADHLRTVDLGKPSAKPPAQPASNQDKELTDFLAPPERDDEIGRLGGYRILKILGAGGMGVVYDAEDPALQRRVALKAMLPTLAASGSARQRFLREARAAAAVEHERIVPIFQVGEDRGVPYLVMPLLKGESLEERLNRVGRLSVSESVRVGRETAEALAAAHERGLIHRDVKPANVWLEGARGSVKLLDFGLARAAEIDTPLTQQGSIVGTPAFMAPEQANGENVDARCDLFSLGCVLYRCCTGVLPFQGTSAVSTLMAVVGKRARPPLDIAKDVPDGLSQLIMHLLAKDPAERPQSAQAVIETLLTFPAPADATAVLRPVGHPTENVKLPTGRNLPAPKNDAPPATPATHSPSRSKSRLLLVALGALGVVIAAGAVIAIAMAKKNRPIDNPAVIPPAGPIEIGIAYGTEKQGWFKEAVTDFAATPEGKDIKINLIPMGSVEGGQAVAKNEDQRIHVWSPASAMYKAAFVNDWHSKHPGQNPVIREEPLCMTPMVFVFWKDRYDVFIKKYKTVTFATLAEAMHAKEGWGDIAGKPEWGKFRFGQTNPDQSNSGLMALLMMACELNHDRPVTPADLANKDFQARITSIKQGLAGTSNSTGNLMKDMVTKGPSAFDAVIIYENLAIDYLKAAQGRWGDLHVAYPPRNIWNENPYYILDVPWSSKDQRRAAEAFLTFLLNEAEQRKAFNHGFRPVNINIPIRDNPESPFVKHKERGLNVDILGTCDPGGPETISELLKVWDRAK